MVNLPYAREKNYKWYLDSDPTLDYIQHTDNNFTGANVGFKSFKRLKEVSSGEALKKANDLTNILNLKKIEIKRFLFINIYYKLFLFCHFR